LTRRTTADLEAVLDRLVRRDLVRVISDRLSPEYGHYVFVQSVVRQVAYRTLSRRDRLHWHLAAATYLQTLPEAGGSLAGAITQHLLDAHDLLAPGDRRHDEITVQVVTWLEHTGDRARALGSPVDAMRAYGQALQRCPAGSASAARIRLAAAEVASAAGRYTEAIRYAEPLPATFPAAQRARVDEVRAWALRANGDVPTALSVLQPWLADLDRIPAEIGADVCRTASSCHVEQGEHRESRELAERGLLLAEDTGDPHAIARSLNMVALSTQAAGLTRMALALYKGLAEFAGAHGLSSMVCLAEVNIGASMLNVDPEQCVLHSREGIELGTQTGELARVLIAACNVAMACRVLGRWDEVGALVDLPSIADSIADDLVEARWIVIERAIIGLARGDRDLDLPEPKPDEGGILAIWNPLPAGILAFAARDYSAALAAAREALAACMEQMGLVDDFCHHWTLAVDWAVAAREYGVARELLGVVEQAPPGQVEPLVAAQLPRLRGSVEAEDPDSAADPAVVESDLRAGIEALDRFGAAPDRARAQATLGLWLRRQGRTAEATPLLAAARTTFGELRAAAWLQELDASLSAAA
jgi:tetratricopeptide (TPR) repeat protein